MIYAITGPTGTGKSALAIEFARRIGGHIVNADAFQVYLGMDIGTNKVPASVMDEIPHHLFDIRTPKEGYDVAQYQSDARNVIAELTGRNIPIIFVGGTGLYLRAVLYDYVFPPEEFDGASKYVSMETPDLYDRLLEVDPLAAAAIHPHNRRRLIRALSIHDGTGIAKSAHLAATKPNLLYETTFVGITVARDELYRHLDLRVDQMVAAGLVAEVAALRDQYGKDARGLQAIGYKEMMAYLEGNASMETAIAAIKLATRHYVKRQMTFFRHQLPMKWFATKEETLRFLLEMQEHE